jgi:hypothetical protein
MVADWRGDTADVQFVLFKIAGVAILSHALQLGLQLLETPDRVGRHSLQVKLPHHLFPFLFRHKGQHDLAHSGAVQWNGRADPRVNSKLLGRVDLLNIDSGESVANREMNGFASLLIQLQQVGQAEAANIELSQSGLANREACQSEVIDTACIAIQKSGRLQVHQKTVHRADGQTGKSSHLHGAHAALELREQLQKSQSPLEGGDVVFALCGLVHEEFRGPFPLWSKNESANYLLKNAFTQANVRAARIS